MGEKIVKLRSYASLRAFQLLGVAHATRMLKKALPEKIEEYNLVIPTAFVKVRLCGVLVEAEQFIGEQLLEKVYRKATQDEAVRIGALVFKVLYQAEMRWWWGRCLGFVYPFVRNYKALRLQSRAPLVLTDRQCTQLKKVLRHKPGQPGTHLVHGDLHAGNILVNHPNQQVGLIDLELVHIGSPAVDFSALWTSYYLADPDLGCQFYQASCQLVPEVKATAFLETVYVELVRNTFFLIHKGIQGGNEQLKMRATRLLICLLEVADFPSFLSGKNRENAD